MKTSGTGLSVAILESLEPAVSTLETLQTVVLGEGVGGVGAPFVVSCCITSPSSEMVASH
jgi:hypothetical protein